MTTRWTWRLTRLTIFLLVESIAVPVASFAQTSRPTACVARPGAPQPIIDVHMHAVGAGGSAPFAADTAGLHAVIAELDRTHVIAVVVSSLALPRTLQWVQRDTRFIGTLAFRDTSMSVDTVRALLQRGTVHGLGELGFQYAGLRPDDPALDKYFAVAEELDTPVAIHMAGAGLPDVPGFRVRLGDPLLLEEVLIRHPRLRVNVMHAGLPYLEGTLAIMRRYPQVYADLSKISDSTAYPRAQFHDYLRTLMRANLGKRLMFGSDAAGPGAITAGIDGITSAAFLTSSQRRDILCDNAARFYRLGVSKAGGGGRGPSPTAENKRVAIIQDYASGLAGVLQEGVWQSIRISFAEIRPNPYFQPPDARKGAPIDVSEVNGLGFAPQDKTAGRLAISRFVVIE